MYMRNCAVQRRKCRWRCGSSSSERAHLILLSFGKEILYRDVHNLIIENIVLHLFALFVCEIIFSPRDYFFVAFLCGDFSTENYVVTFNLANRQGFLQ